MCFKNIFNSLITFFISINPPSNFLSDIAAFEAVVIGIAIPLSFEIVSRISERYKSEVITKQFFREWEIKILPYFLMINISLAIILRFIFQEEKEMIYQKVLTWLSLLGFVFVAFVLILLVNKLKKYISDTKFILDKLFYEADKIFKEEK